jgi:hypothetical protein
MSTMFIIDEVRKVAVEIIIPFLIKYLADKKIKKNNSIHKK